MRLASLGAGVGNFLSASSAAALGDEVTVTLLEDDDRWQGCIDSPISKKRSLTKFKVIETKPWLEGELSLVEFQIMTGRKHQIRRHCQKLGCPILGDLRYGPYTKREKNDNAVEVEVFGSTATYGAGWNFYFKVSELSAGGGLEDEHTRNEVREMATDIMATSTT